MGAIVKKPGEFSQDLQFSEWLSNVLQVISPPKKKKKRKLNGEKLFLLHGSIDILSIFNRAWCPLYTKVCKMKWAHLLLQLWGSSLLFCAQLSTEQCFGSSKGLRILGALYQLDRGKPILHNVTALKKNCGDLLHFPQRSAEILPGREHWLILCLISRVLLLIHRAH